MSKALKVVETLIRVICLLYQTIYTLDLFTKRNVSKKDVRVLKEEMKSFDDYSLVEKNCSCI